MSDVAREAGVSLVTVSRVINTPEQVAPATRAAVQAVVARLGYVPNLTAGSLATSRSRIVAAIVPTIANLVFSETIEALTQTLAEGGHQLLVGQSGYRAADEAALVETFLGRRVDGLVLTGCHQPPALRVRLRQAELPVVQTWDLPEPGGAPVLDMAVGFSNVAAGAAAAGHLLGRGHRLLGFLGADEDRSRLRLQGFQAAAAAQGAEVLTALLRPPATMAQAAQRLVEMVTRQPALSAVFCNNDLLATAVLFECLRQGWDVPRRLAILGFGDLPVAELAVPPLSTVRVRRGEIGTRAGQLLLARLGHGGDAATGALAATASRVDIGFELVVRGST
ncbi:LacI family DNA-binding transcriptional regulator [Pseudaquabacterium rugosum]|jgi:LacI family gluconate utilization system Gnt-I transcriptional repressor|uniref:LacI family DNA-binding transcriptional regulator n=1 Tax=Pseudaquabacterium rugosum TaxID=2984194 RepID=A0ABU9BER8_9BURK